MIDVSILTPARNAALTIRRAIDSALSQDGVSVEVIVSENGSTDDTRAMLSTIDDPRLHILDSHADGVGASLNECGEVATGRYFVELDADDWFAPDCLALLVAALDHAPSHVGFAHGCVRYHGDQSFLYTPRQYTRHDYRRGFMCLYPFVYRRQAWDSGCRYADHIYTEGRWLSVQDYDFALQLVEFMRYNGLALPDVLVLNYTFNRQAEGQSVGARHQAELLAAFRARWPMVEVERLT